MPADSVWGCWSSATQSHGQLANHVKSSGSLRFLIRTLSLSTVVALCTGAGQPVESTTALSCPSHDVACEKDKFGYEAVRQLHSQIDDDHNGNLDRTESDGFMRDELKYEDGFDRQVNFHGGDDQITVPDLWHLWVQSDVYNWTVDEVIDWLVTYVELPQYAQNFRINAVDGKTLPRLAANGQYLTNILGIKNAVNKQKLALKAMDAVLFGAPKMGHSYVKDVALVASLVIATGGCWLAYVQHRYSQKHLRKVMKDLEMLQSAEDALTQVQDKLDQAQADQESVVQEKKHLESKLNEEIVSAKDEAERLRHTREATAEEISRLKLAEEELVQVRRALRRAEKELEDRQNAPLAELQQWLQLTHELESRHCDTKREAAEAQLMQCKEMCEKIRRKRGAFLGSLRIAHTTSMDDTDSRILKARAALEEIKTDLQERSHRWLHIEQICGFNIVHNPGLQYLESMLTGYSRDSGTGRPLLGSLMSPLDETDEDVAPFSALNSASSAMLQPPSPDFPRRASPVTVLHQRSPSPNPVSGVPGGVDNEMRVWPNLMRAGMQLTMFGLGMTNPQLAALQPQGLDKRPSHSLLRALGSSSSLQTMVPPQLQQQQQQLHHPVNNGSSSSTSHHVAADTDSETEASGSRTSLGNGAGLVSFGLPEDEELRNRSRSFGKSQSLEAKQVMRPKAFPASVSMPVIPADPSVTCSKKSPSASDVHVSPRAGTPPSSSQHDGNSSPESMDSVSLDGENKKKKKKRLIPKLLGSRKGKDS